MVQINNNNPLVSIVMATYNRSNIVGYAIQSVLHSTMQNWELIIIGDCCTDDTAAVVQSFNDKRINFLNLEQNYGEQTGPNNIGVAMARGKYLAFLNHDDLWLPGHLQHSVSILEAEEIDLVFGQGLVIAPNGQHYLNGALCAERQPYAPGIDVPATLWLMRREFSAKVGPWKPSWQIRTIPSQEWLYRAWRTGAKIVANPQLSALLIPSGIRYDAYKNRQHAEHIFWFAQLQNESALRKILSAICGQALHENRFGSAKLLRGFIKIMVRRWLLAFGVWVPYPRYWFKYWRKGAFLRDLRQRRGLHELKNSGEKTQQ